MKISKSLIKQSIKEYEYGNLERNRCYISYLDIDKLNVVHRKFEIPANKVYRKGVDLTNKKLLIVTAFALGDSIHFLPILKAIKRAYEGVYIGYEYKKNNKLLLDNPYIDELVSNPISIDVIDKFDYIFDLTAHVATVGFDNQFVPDYLASLFDEKIFGFYEKDKKPDISLSNNPEVIENINKIKDLSKGRPILGVHFEASSIHRRIPPDVLDIVLNYAKDRYTIVSAYTDAGKELAKEYFEKYPFIIDVSSYVKDVEHLVHYVNILDILISAETSVAHIGVALGGRGRLGVPTLVVLGASSFEAVYDYKVPYIKGVNARYVGLRCSSPCRIHALNTPCPEAKFLKELKKQEDDYSPCFKFIDRIELLETFKSLEKLVENLNLMNGGILLEQDKDKTIILPPNFEELYSYYYKSKIVNDYIGSAHLYFYKFRHNIYYFVREFALKNKLLKIEGYDKALYEEILKDALDITIDETSNNIIITDGFYRNIDFEKLKDKKALIIFANKNRVYNFVKKGVDVFDLGVVKQNVIEYSKEELSFILSKYFKSFKIYETPANIYEYESVFGKSVSLEDQLAHNTFLRDAINSLQGAFLVVVVNEDIKLRHHLDTFSAMQYEYLVADKYKDISFYTKSSKNSDFDIVELNAGKKLKVFLAFDKDKNSPTHELHDFYKTFKELDCSIYTAFIPEQDYNSKKDTILTTLSNIGIDIVFTDFKNLKQKTYLNYISSKIVFIDRESTFEDLINQFKDKEDKKDDILKKLSAIFDKFSPSKTIYLSTDSRVVEFLKDKSLDARHFYGYFIKENKEKSTSKDSKILFLSECSIHKTYADNSITEFFIKKLSNFRTSLKALKEDIALHDLREYFYDYLYMGAYALKYNDKTIKHVGIIDFGDEMVFRIALSTISKTRDFPVVIHPKDVKDIINSKNIIIGLSDIISDTLNKRFFEAFGNKTMFITDYKPILEDMFGKYGEYVSGFSIEDIVEKANYFKENKQETKDIINYISKSIQDFELKKVIKGVI